MKIGQKGQMPPPPKLPVKKPQVNTGNPPPVALPKPLTTGASNPFASASLVQGNLNSPIPPPGVGGRLQVHA